MKAFRVRVAYGPYVKGQIIQPTGMYRQLLLSRQLIEEVKDEQFDVPPELDNREIRPSKTLFKRGQEKRR